MMLSYRGCLSSSVPEPLPYYELKDPLTGEISANPVVNRNQKLFYSNQSYYRIPYGLVDNPQLVTRPMSIQVPQCSIALRPQQEEAANACPLRSDHFAILYALPTAFGKTILSLALLHRIKERFLIVAPKVELLKQWKTEAKRFLDLDVDMIDWKKDVDAPGYLITVQGLTRKIKSDPSVVYDFLASKGIGVMVLDEVHLMPTAMFSHVLLSMFVPKTIGLSATVERKDMAHTLFPFLFPTRYELGNPGRKQATTIRIVRYKDPHFQEEHIKVKGKVIFSTAKMLNTLCADKSRFDLLCSTIRKLDADRHVLALCDRVELCKDLHRAFPEDSGLIIGNAKNIEEAKTKRILFATYSMVNEGFNVPRLNTLFLMTPRSSIEQTIGRIYRQIHDETPLIIDLVDLSSSLYMAQYMKRKRLYREKIERVHFVSTDEEEKKIDFAL